MAQRFKLIAALVSIAVLFSAGQAAADPGGPNTPAAVLGTAFTYQGQLSNGGGAINGSCDMAFRVFDAALAGTQAGQAVTTTVTVSAGLFTVPLDFGGGAFNGRARWLEIRVKCGADPVFNLLAPRQELTPTPYALALPGLRVQQDVNSPSLIGGYAGNIVTGASALGVTIAGGGAPGQVNAVRGSLVGFSTIGGGLNNVISGTSAYDNVIAGGSTNKIDGASAYENVISGGSYNVISGAAATNSVISGGTGNAINGIGTVVGGGLYNLASGNLATVAGGNYNQATGAGATVGGGGWDGSNNLGNLATGTADTIGGGISNTTSLIASTVGGGQGNQATFHDATVAGGYFNTADGWNATIGGGTFNHAAGAGAFIGGGGWDGTNQGGNTASGDASAIGGGLNNTASGRYASVPGGSGNHAIGQGSFAAGTGATANNTGAFVWNCNGCAAATSTAAGQFVVNASGGVWIGSGTTGGPTGNFIATNLISTSVGARLTIGGLWTDVSDVNAKTDFAPVNNLQVLDTLMAMPVQTWRYKVETDGSRHMGPTAQDFYAAFNVGNDNTHIAALDTSGVALAAIQGLGQEVQDQAKQIAAQQQVNADLQARLSALEQKASGGPAPATGLPLGWLLFGALALLNLGGLAGYALARRAGQKAGQA